MGKISRFHKSRADNETTFLLNPFKFVIFSIQFVDKLSRLLTHMQTLQHHHKKHNSKNNLRPFIEKPKLKTNDLHHNLS